MDNIIREYYKTQEKIANLENDFKTIVSSGNYKNIIKYSEELNSLNRTFGQIQVKLNVYDFLNGD